MRGCSLLLGAVAAVDAVESSQFQPGSTHFKQIAPSAHHHKQHRSLRKAHGHAGGPHQLYREVNDLVDGDQAQLGSHNASWSIQEQCHPHSDHQPKERENWHYVVIKKVMTEKERATRS